MQEHIEQAQHNEKLLSILNNQMPDEYCDWKVTITFYICLHLLRAYGKKLKVNIPAGHSALNKAVNGSVGNGGLSCSKQVINAYFDLLNLSFTMRYNGFMHLKDFNIFARANFASASRDMQIIKDFLSAKGLKF